MKVFTLTLLTVLLLIGNANTAKIRRDTKRARLEDAKSTSEKEAAVKAEIPTADADKKEKEIHKRGIHHYSGTLTAASNLWPKNYASHYGYGLHLPAASGFSVAPLSATHLHSPSVLRYNTGFHYKTLAAPAVLSGASGLGSFSAVNTALPAFSTLSPATTHVHPVATVQPFIIRPGGAVVQSYSVTYPHRKPAVAVKPVHGFAVHHAHPVHQHVADVKPVHAFQHIHPIEPIQTIHPVAGPQPVQPLATVQPVAVIPPVQHLHPVPPASTVVQVEHFKPPVHYDFTQQLPLHFQTSFVPPAPVPIIPQGSPVSFSPVQSSFPAIPTFPNLPAFPTIPALPSVPDVPAVPAIPDIPTIPSIPNFPQPQVPGNGFFPVSVQPPLNQKPPIFANINPQAQFPDLGTNAGNKPDFGSAEASSQIPVQPLPSAETEFLAPQPEPTQEPWKPVLYEPPNVGAALNRPSNTLLPPYGNSPAQAYLPPATFAKNGRIQEEYSIDSNLFDNLSDADIQHIFTQAHLAAQRDHNHHHHTVHNYHTRY